MDDAAPDQTTGALQVSPRDRDLTIRTLIGEAGNQSDLGKAAVANVIMNRVASGKWGNLPSDVVLAKGQFEPWSTRSNELMSYAPNSPQYQAAAKIVDGVFSGSIPDVTGGMTHFYSPSAQAALGRSAPKWAQSDGLQIGAHAFFAPEGRISAQIGSINLPSFSQQSSDPALSPQASSMNSDDLINLYLKPQAGTAATQPNPSAAAPSTPTSNSTTSPAAAENDLIKLYMKPIQQADTQAVKAPVQDKPLADDDNPQVMGSRAYWEADKSVPKSSGRTTSGEEIGKNVAKVIDYAAGQVGQVPGQIASDFNASKNLASSGIADVQKGNYAPSFPSADPSTWSAGGVLKTVGGGLGAVYAPMTGAISKLVEDPTTQLTGNPDIGARAGFVGNALVGGELAGPAKMAGNKLSNIMPDVIPATRARTALQDAGAGSLSADAVSQLQANPRLTLMDVDPNLLLRGQGIAAQAGAGRTILNDLVNNSRATGKDAVTTAANIGLGETPDTVALLAQLKDTAKSNASKGFGEALDNAKPVNVSPIIDSIDTQIKPGVNAITSPSANFPPTRAQIELAQIRNKLTDGNSILTDPNKLHEIQSSLRNEVDTLKQSASGDDRRLAYTLSQVRNQLVDAIDSAAEGKYKPAQKQYASDMAVESAFNKGLSIFQNRSGEAGLSDRPEAWREILKNASPDEVAAIQQGVRVAMDQKVNSVRNPTQGAIGVSDVGFNQDKLAAVVGDQEASRLTKMLADEKRIAQRNGDLMNGSQTVARNQGIDATKVRPSVGFSPGNIGVPIASELMGTWAGYPGATAAAMTGIAGARFAGNKLLQASDAARNAEMARYLSMPGAKANQLLNSAIPQAPVGPYGRLAAGSIPSLVSQQNKLIYLPASSN